MTTAPPLEVADLLWQFAGGERRTVDGSEAVARLEASGQQRAARLVADLTRGDGSLDTDRVDALLLRMHGELHALSQELRTPQRVAAGLRPLVQQARAQDPGSTVSVLDVGCGLGLVPRWLAATQALGPDVELVGLDVNPVLVAHARELAAADGAAVRFEVADARSPDLPVDDPRRTIVVSTVLLHHLTVDELRHMLGTHAQAGVAAFLHWDIDPGAWATVGAWLVHRARMQEAVSRHDGVLSARRAHRAATLLAAAEAAAGYVVTCVDGWHWLPPRSEAIRPLTGIRESP